MEGSLRILHLEDDRNDAELVRKALSSARMSCDIRCVDTREDFVRAIEASPFDLILSDYTLPQFDGRSALGIAREKSPDVPFIFVSGTLGEDAAVECLVEGATDYVLKHRLERLVTAVERVVRETDQRRERQRAEDALRDSEARFRRLAENAPDLIYRYRLHPARGFEYVSPAAERMTGYTPEEHYSQPDLVLNLVHPDDRPVIEKILETGEVPVGPVTVRWSCKDGSTVWVEERHTVVRDGSGAVVALDGIVRDVTERRQLEEQLRHSQKMEAVGRLAGGVAHDFNNLLTAIMGYNELALRSVAPHDPVYADLLEVRKASGRAASLTRQLLAFSRRQVLQPRVLDLNALVTDMERLLRRLIGEDVRFTISKDADLWTVLADDGQIEQVILNLVVNSRDAMPHGGQITVQTANVPVGTGYRLRRVGEREGDYVMLAVSDTGIGMDANTKAHLFEPFFTTKEHGKGTGLGLSTVYGIVKQSGGSIWVDSASGRGTTFRIYLPRVAAASEPVVAVSVVPDVGRGTEAILLVEDEEVLRELASRVLREGGYTVLAAPTAREALQAAERFEGRIELLVTDVVMPGHSGPELAKSLSSTRPDLKVLFMSGYTTEGMTRQGALEQGIVLLQKPFSPSALVRAVRDVLDATASAASRQPLKKKGG